MKCLGERFRDAWIAAHDCVPLIPYSQLSAKEVAKWNRAAVAFTAQLSDANPRAEGGEREALELDAARYRWLRVGRAYDPADWGIAGGRPLDEAIDAELAKRLAQQAEGEA